MHTDPQLNALEQWAATGEATSFGQYGLPVALPRSDLSTPNLRGLQDIVRGLVFTVREVQRDLASMERHNKRLVDDLHAAEENLRDRVMMAVLGQVAGSLWIESKEDPAPVPPNELGRRAYFYADAVLSQRNGKPPEAK